MSAYGPPCPFRAVGFTWRAGMYPLSAAALAVIAEHNGVAAELLPRGARFASSRAMQVWIEALGAAREAGRIVRDLDGRWFTPSRIAACG